MNQMEKANVKFCKEVGHCLAVTFFRHIKIQNNVTTSGKTLVFRIGNNTYLRKQHCSTKGLIQFQGKLEIPMNGTICINIAE